MRNFWFKYKHAVPLILYAAFYITWFMDLERRVTSNYTVIHMKVDNYIPFCEVFIIPYLLWFAYVAAVVVYLFFADKKDYYRLCIFLFTGMTIFLIVSSLFPNGQHLRPAVFPRDNIFTQMIGTLYKTDTATNIVPSIHAYNAIGAHIAIAKCQKLRGKKLIQTGSFILSLSIILSTVFIKQHSAFDVITACLMAIVLYTLVYAIDYSMQGSKGYQRRHNTES